ncbi:hypothetical protein B296_00011683 [Ensete ventricosum]|uniref:Uncharacterized protein n=1 Tax=Ensete ventricosum TaxID=4639 RepID=A0A426XZA4_ENSVE|nr:hypothetical protein B296_00011683 [Ensete ventricosum]
MDHHIIGVVGEGTREDEVGDGGDEDAQEVEEGLGYHSMPSVELVDAHLLENPRTPVVTPEAFQGLTNQVQAIAGMLHAIIPYIPQLAQQPSSRPLVTPLPQIRVTLPLNEPPPMTRSANNPLHFSWVSD